MEQKETDWSKLTPEQRRAESIRRSKMALERDITNIRRLVIDGKPLSRYHRRMLERHAGVVDRAEVIEALEVVKAAVCVDCEEQIERFMENLKNVD